MLFPCKPLFLGHVVGGTGANAHALFLHIVLLVPTEARPPLLVAIREYLTSVPVPHLSQPIGSENLTGYFREAIESAFNCPVADQYGAAEMAGFLGQCEYGTYHASMEFGIIEILKDDTSPAQPGEAGQLICTGFLNKAMPFMVLPRISGDLEKCG